MTAAVNHLQVCKRNGVMAPFDATRIENAIRAAFVAELGLEQAENLASELQRQIAFITEDVIVRVSESTQNGGEVDVERIQDVVELMLMRHGHYATARRYIVYREERARARALRESEVLEKGGKPPMVVTKADGTRVSLDRGKLLQSLQRACSHLDDPHAAESLLEEVSKQLYDGITIADLHKAKILAARSRIEHEPDYDHTASRLLLDAIYQEVLGDRPQTQPFDAFYRSGFQVFLQKGIDDGQLDPPLKQRFDTARIAATLQPERDEAFPYLGLQTIYDRYLLHIGKQRIETPQFFWMRVAMGLALCEDNPTERAIQFYSMLSTFRFISATPTLFNSGTTHPQLSSCYLSTTQDDLEHIFKVIRDNAMLSKWAGGLGNDWTNIRATNAHIKGTNGQSQGIVPFLKVVNDTAVAVNQGGKRKGAVCSYLETWHYDLEEFLDLRKNTGDDRRRTHDMHTANWIPDLFIKRVEEQGQWTLFSPDEVPDLHDLYGQAFEARYQEYERQADAGKIGLYKRVDAVDLWRKMLTRLFETGHPWITWKDPSNIRSPQDHAGVVHSSNLCTEILLNTSQDETAVCNLGSINLKEHVTNGRFDTEKLRETIVTAVRMLDNVIDINYYPTAEARNSNLRHRPIGLGVMGFQDALYQLGISYASKDAARFADESMEAISYYAILASTQLAAERGTYSTFEGSKWSRGLLPIDSIDLLEQERGQPVEMDRTCRKDWTPVRQAMGQHGMRNSNVMAIAPTATISQIVGATQSIEPTYKNLFAKSNLSGEFTAVNRFLVSELKQRGLWSQEMLDELKYYDGSVQDIKGMPDDMRERYKTAFEIEPQWLIECAARRQKWIDMSQSLNLYLDQPSGKKLDRMYRQAWKMGLKTTYYLRCQAATQVEKSTLDVNKFGVQPRWMKNPSASSDIKIERHNPSSPCPQNGTAPQACSIDDPDCEACQ